MNGDQTLLNPSPKLGNAMSQYAGIRKVFPGKKLSTTDNNLILDITQHHEVGEDQDMCALFRQASGSSPNAPGFRGHSNLKQKVDDKKEQRLLDCEHLNAFQRGLLYVVQ